MFPSFRPHYNLGYGHITSQPNEYSLSFPSISIEACMGDKSRIHFLFWMISMDKSWPLFTFDLIDVHGQPVGALMTCTWMNMEKSLF